jgi:hypothetical protein
LGYDDLSDDEMIESPKKYVGKKNQRIPWGDAE